MRHTYYCIIDMVFTFYKVNNLILFMLLRERLLLLVLKIKNQKVKKNPKMYFLDNTRKIGKDILSKFIL